MTGLVKFKDASTGKVIWVNPDQIQVVCESHDPKMTWIHFGEGESIEVSGSHEDVYSAIIRALIEFGAKA